jgi:hypothetical protein
VRVLREELDGGDDVIPAVVGLRDERGRRPEEFVDDLVDLVEGIGGDHIAPL